MDIIKKTKKPRAYYLRGLAYLCQDKIVEKMKYNLSMECFEQAIVCDEHYILAFAMKAYVETLLENYDKA